MTRVVFWFKKTKDVGDGNQPKKYWATGEDFTRLYDKYNSETYSSDKYRVIFYIPACGFCPDYYIPITKKIGREFRKLDYKDKYFSKKYNHELIV